MRRALPLVLAIACWLQLVLPACVAMAAPADPPHCEHPMPAADTGDCPEMRHDDGGAGDEALAPPASGLAPPRALAVTLAVLDAGANAGAVLRAEPRITGPPPLVAFGRLRL